MTTSSTTALWKVRTMFDNSWLESWIDSTWNEFLPILHPKTIISTFVKPWFPASSCRYVSPSVNLLKPKLKLKLVIGGSPWTQRRLLDNQRQPGGVPAPLISAGPQARMGHLQRVCADHQKLHPHRDRNQARVVRLGPSFKPHPVSTRLAPLFCRLLRIAPIYYNLDYFPQCEAKRQLEFISNKIKSSRN